MSGFDERWRRLAQAAQRAPSPALPEPPHRRWTLARRADTPRASLVERLAAVAGIGLVAAGWALAVRLGTDLELPDAPPSPAALPSVATAPGVARAAEALGLPRPPAPPPPRALIAAAATLLPDLSLRMGSP